MGLNLIFFEFCPLSKMLMNKIYHEDVVTVTSSFFGKAAKAHCIGEQ